MSLPFSRGLSSGHWVRDPVFVFPSDTGRSTRVTGSDGRESDVSGSLGLPVTTPAAVGTGAEWGRLRETEDGLPEHDDALVEEEDGGPVEGEWSVVEVRHPLPSVGRGPEEDLNVEVFELVKTVHAGGVAGEVPQDVFLCVSWYRPHRTLGGPVQLIVDSSSVVPVIDYRDGPSRLESPYLRGRGSTRSRRRRGLHP